jgi:alpha-mannosidase
MSSESGFQVGVERRMRYALVPHAGDWAAAGIHRAGLEFNHPLVARKAAVHPGPLPARWGLVEVSSPAVVISSLKPARDGSAALRLYEATGRPAPGVTLAFSPGLASATESNLLEDAGAAISVEAGKLTVDLKPFEIKTLLLRFAPAAP